VAKLAVKDPSIPNVLKRLRVRLGSDAFVLSDHWEPDLFAVGIASPRNLGVLVYISTYREPAGLFEYELELPPSPGDGAQYKVAGRASGVSFEELASVVAAHLNNGLS
jgi:hypothetical protein